MLVRIRGVGRYFTIRLWEGNRYNSFEGLSDKMKSIDAHTFLPYNFISWKLSYRNNYTINKNILIRILIDYVILTVYHWRKLQHSSIEKSLNILWYTDMTEFSNAPKAWFKIYCELNKSPNYSISMETVWSYFLPKIFQSSVCVCVCVCVRVCVCVYVCVWIKFWRDKYCDYSRKARIKRQLPFSFIISNIVQNFYSDVSHFVIFFLQK